MTKPKATFPHAKKQMAMEVRNAKDLSPEEKARLFTHGLHEEGIFYNRLNFFLVFESFLVAAAVSGFSGKGAPPFGFPIAIVGLMVSFLWWYAQVAKLAILKTLEERVEEAYLDFQETISLSTRKRQQYHLHWSATRLLAHALPLIFVVWWGYILIRLWP